MLIDHFNILFCEASKSFVYFPTGPALFFSFILKSSLCILDVYQFEGEIYACPYIFYINLSLGLYYLKFVAFKECCLAKIFNLDTKAIAYLLFHPEEFLDSVLIE